MSFVVLVAPVVATVGVVPAAAGGWRAGATDTTVAAPERPSALPRPVKGADNDLAQNLLFVGILATLAVMALVVVRQSRRARARRAAAGS